jgi:ribosomal protein S10
MLLFKRNLVFFNLKRFFILFYSAKVIYYFIKSKLIIFSLPLSFQQFQSGTLKLNGDYKLKLVTLSLKDLDTFVLLSLEKLSILKINSKLSYLPKQLNIITMLRSPFVYKKTQEQLIIKKYTAILYLQYNTYDFFYQNYLVFLIKNRNSFLSKIQYNKFFLWNIND